MAYKQIKRKKEKSSIEFRLLSTHNTQKISFYPQQCLLLPSIFLLPLAPKYNTIFFVCTFEEFPHKESRCFHCVCRNRTWLCVWWCIRRKWKVLSQEKSYNIIASKKIPQVKWQKWRGERKKLTCKERKKVRTFPRFLCLPKCGEFLFSFMFEDFLMNDMKCKHFALALATFEKEQKFFLSFFCEKIKSLFLSFRLFSLCGRVFCDKFQMSKIVLFCGMWL